MKCVYDEINSLPPCVSLPNRKYGSLEELFLNKNTKERYLTIVQSLGCLSIDNSHIRINQSNCIKCLFCIVNCPQNLISIGKDFILQEKCSEFEGKNEIDKNIVGNFFNKELIEITYFNNLANSSNYKTLDDFTKIHETKNIAVWAASLIKYLSSDPDCRLGLEINMIIESKNRGGRLDICLFSNKKFLFAIETKISFTKMMSENRYTSQMISYKKEIQKTLAKNNLHSIENFNLLLIGDKETDLLFAGHPMCTSNVGNQSKLFYENLVNHKLFFISSMALWCITLKKMLLNQQKYSLENIFSKINHSNNYGLVSAGVITKQENGFFIIPLDSFLDD